MRHGSWVVVLLLTGCAHQPVVVMPELPLPAEPALPTITAENIECLSDDTYEALVRREARLKGHIFVLRRIIEDHNSEARQREE